MPGAVNETAHATAICGSQYHSKSRSQVGGMAGELTWNGTDLNPASA